MQREKPIYVSVTLDFLKTLPELNITDNQNVKAIEAGLCALGFEITNQADKIGYEYLDDVVVRSKKNPYKYKKTRVYTGKLRSNFSFKSIYNGIDILDTEDNNSFNLLVSDLPYDLPATDKTNLRKYTKK